MGIKGLAKLLSDEAPDCMREVELKSLHGRKLGIDASMQIYQFLIAVRSGGPNQSATMLTNAEGETTSHIQGMFNRTIRFLSEGIKPAFIFDGKPPEFKSGELQKRREKREKAQAELQKATEEGNVEEQERQSKRLVRAGHKENEDCKKLLRLMGVPVIEAPCEAEAQASALSKEGVFYATATEDMDALTFATPVLVRKMTFANQSKSMVQTINYAKAIEGLALTHDQFVDLCILLGCDYTDTIKGVGPKTALKLIREHKCIEGILKNIDTVKYVVPKEWMPESATDENDDTSNEADSEEQKAIAKEEHAFVPAFVQARKLFHHHEVTKAADLTLKWNEPQVEELTKFLVDENGFSAERVQQNIEKLQKAHKANQKPQTRMDSFFQVKANPIVAKRKPQEPAKKATAKKAKTAGGRRRR
eukprot:Nitzschia sp. Nitz4//scaffold17_size182527//42553//44038//NITZ4_001837-RA/size182527-snap-gene-0.274-mRNA-1//1//CDS//3329539289//5097//frame0